MALSHTSVLKLYNTVIDDVIAGVRDSFLDEGVDEQVLQEMKQIWTNKLLASKAVELAQELPDPPLATSSTAKIRNVSNGTKSKAAKNVVQKDVDSNINSGGIVAGNMQSVTMINGNTKKHINAQAVAAAAAASAATSTTSNTTQASQSAPVQTQKTQPMPAPPSAVAGLDPNKIVPIQITLPAQAGVAGSEQPRVLTIQVPASALQENQLHQVLTGPVITSIMPLPPHIASNVLQQHVNAALQNQAMLANSLSIQKQLDGAADTSDDDGSDDSDDNMDGDDDDDDLDKDDEEIDGDAGAEEEPLNSEDDVTDEDASDLFDTDNVVVCQYDKITRSRNKWKFYLKDGIMNIGGKDYVFQKSNGDAEW